ncbi:MAG: 16S rRNA (cytosine(1402)-N(4))-methyltransferase RsmH [Pirellulaceae bacterium]|nr:16S rRNA (cytosine(1402)-N(4))-methyltransferase RsmH [Pirellulaceae bacterium]
MNDLPEKPPRRRRYSGRNPRNFEDKYKEHQSERYPEDVAKIVESGKTPAGMHRPIMVSEILNALALAPGNVVVDCTLGYGGHARELLSAIQPGGRLLGIDADPIELPKTEARLRTFASPDASIELRRMNFAGVAAFLADRAPEGVDALLADLGVSSMQLDDPTRGFSFKFDGPLDMRMNPRRGKSAAELLSTLNDVQLSALLVENSDEPNSLEIAHAILMAHASKPLESTLALVDVVRAQTKQLGDAETDLTVRRVFQSLRIAVNDELRSLDAFLRQIPLFLKKGGRVTILTFHSGEDRRVKASFKQGFQDGLFSFISKDVIRATSAEQYSNARSSSAKLRIAVRS